MTGHLLGGAGGIESVFTVLALRDQVAPPTINLVNQDPECDLDYCANTAREMKIDVRGEEQLRLRRHQRNARVPQGLTVSGQPLSRRAMRAPPPVEFTSALGRAWRAALSLLVGASVAVPLAWGLPYVAAHWGGRRPDALIDGAGQPARPGRDRAVDRRDGRRRLLAGASPHRRQVSARFAGTARTGCWPATPTAVPTSAATPP